MKEFFIIERRDQEPFKNMLLERVSYVRKNSALVDGQVNEFTNDPANAKSFTAEFKAELYVMRHCMQFCEPNTRYRIVKHFK